MGADPISRRIWDRCVPGDLLQKYQRWDKRQKTIKPSEGVGVSAMFQALREAGVGVALSSGAKPTGTAMVIPNCGEKCSLIYNGIPGFPPYQGFLPAPC